jgi:hypothetical protein
MSLIVAAVVVPLLVWHGQRLTIVSVSAHTIVFRVYGGGVHQGQVQQAGLPGKHVVGLGTSTAWNAGGLTGGTRYSFQLRSCVQGRCGGWSVPVSVSTRTELAGPPPIGCQMFPASNPINQDITALPVDPRSQAYIDSIGAGGFLRYYIGRTPIGGMPYSVVGPGEPLVGVRFTAYGGESDRGPYPVPLDAPVEQSSDEHVLTVQTGTCRLYELYAARPAGQGWDAQSGAVFDLASNTLRPDGWTSADAAGLPILPLLVRYDEVQSGQIKHALRVTVNRTQEGFIHPATHFSSSSRDPALPPMGLRLRLKASFDLSGYSGAALAILTTLKRYGMFVADDGPSWYISGAPDPRWDNSSLQQLRTVPATAFEAVQTGPILR